MSQSRAFSLLLALFLAFSTASAFRPSVEAYQPADPIPVAIRFPQVLVDTAIEPIEIVDGIPGVPTGLWSVGRYEGQGPLDQPGGQIFYGFSEYWGSPGVFRYLNQSQPGHSVIVSDSDGLNYEYIVDSIETFSMQASPADVYAPPAGADYWLLLTAPETVDPAIGLTSGIVVVRASRPSDDVPVAPAAAPGTSSGQETCPGLDLIAQSLYPDTASMGLPEAVETPVRTINELEQILVTMPACEFLVKEALTLTDGNILALVGPEGQVPLDALTGAVDAPSGTVLDAQRATLYRYVLFVQEGDIWNAFLPPA